MNRKALIMAGEHRKRFCPKSLQNLPKRLLSLVDTENISLATNQDCKGLVRGQLLELPVQNILCGLVGKNTALCIDLSTIHITKYVKTPRCLYL